MGTQEIIIAITIMAVVLDLIITGIIGLRTKIIYPIDPKTIYRKLLFLPLGTIGKIAGMIPGNQSSNPNVGKAAIATSMATIMLGACIMAFSAAMLAEELFDISRDMKNFIVTAIITGSMIIMLVSIAFMKDKEQ